MLNKIKRFLMFQFTVGIVLAIAGGIWYTNKNNPDNTYFVESKIQLNNNTDLTKLLGEGWAFDGYQLIQKKGPTDTVTLGIKSSSGYKCIRGKITKNKDRYIISDLELANKQLSIAPSSAPYCAFALFENIEIIKNPVNKAIYGINP